MSRQSVHGSQPEPPDLVAVALVSKRSPLTRSVNEADPLASKPCSAFDIFDSIGTVITSPRVRSPVALRFSVQQGRLLVDGYSLVRTKAQVITQHRQTEFQHPPTVERQ